MSVSGWNIYTMPIENVDAQTLDAFLQDQLEQNLVSESRTLELKSKRTSSVIDTIAAFANTVGGIVLVGIDEAEPTLQSAPGVKRDEHTSLTQSCMSRLDPVFVPEIGVVAIPGKDRVVLVVRVEPQAATRPVLVNGQVFVRTPGSTVGATRDQIQRLFERPAYGIGTTTTGNLDNMFRLDSSQEIDLDACDFVIRAAGSVTLRATSAEEFYFGKAERDYLCHAFAQSNFGRPRIRFNIDAFPGTSLPRYQVTDRSTRRVRAVVTYGQDEASEMHRISLDVRKDGAWLAYAVTWEGRLASADTVKQRRDAVTRHEPAARAHIWPHELTSGLVLGLEAVGQDIPAALAHIMSGPPASIGASHAWISVRGSELSESVELGFVTRPHDGQVRAFGLVADPAPTLLEDITGVVMDRLTRLLVDLGVDDETTIASKWIHEHLKDREDLQRLIEQGRI